MMRVPSLQSVERNVMPPMKPLPNLFVPQNPNSLSNWVIHKINEAGAAQARDRRKRQTSRRVKNLVEMVERLKKRLK
jgi:hypothetical protein